MLKNTKNLVLKIRKICVKKLALKIQKISVKKFSLKNKKKLVLKNTNNLVVTHLRVEKIQKH